MDLGSNRDVMVGALAPLPTPKSLIRRTLERHKPDGDGRGAWSIMKLLLEMKCRRVLAADGYR